MNRKLLFLFLLLVIIFSLKVSYGYSSSSIGVYILLGPSPNSLINVSLGSLILSYDQSLWLSSNQALHFTLIDPEGKVVNDSTYYSASIQPVKIYFFNESSSTGIWNIKFLNVSNGNLILTYQFLLIDNKIKIRYFNYSGGLNSSKGLYFNYSSYLFSNFSNPNLFVALATSHSFLNYTKNPVIVTTGNKKITIGTLAINQSFSNLNGQLQLIFTISINYFPNTTLSLNKISFVSLQISKYIALRKEVGSVTTYLFLNSSLVNETIKDYSLSSNITLTLSQYTISTGLIFVKLKIFNTSPIITANYNTTLMLYNQNDKVYAFNILSLSTPSYTISNSTNQGRLFNIQDKIDIDYNTLSEIFITNQSQLLKNIDLAFIEEENTIYGLSFEPVIHPIEMVSFYNLVNNEQVTNYIISVNNSQILPYKGFIFLDKAIHDFNFYLNSENLTSKILNVSSIPFIPFTYQKIALKLYQINITIEDEKGIINNSILFVSENNHLIYSSNLTNGFASILLPFGNYNIQAKASGHFNSSSNIFVDSNKNFYLKLQTIEAISNSFILYAYLTGIVIEIIACAYIIRKILK